MPAPADSRAPSEVEWTTGTFPSGGEVIYYESAGRGAAVVFCHGLGGNHAVWYQQVPVFATAYRAVTWDQRGFGLSTNRASGAGPLPAAQDLGRLLDHLEISSAHLVGQSMGGWAVLGFALRSPERVRSLVITDSTAGVMTDEIAAIISTTTRASLPQPVLGRHPAIGTRLSAEDVTKAFLYQQIGGFRSGISDAEMVGLLYTTRYPIDDIRRLSMPTLLVVGSEDDLIPPEAVHGVAEVIPAARVVEIPRAGHSPYFERPPEWNDAVLEFLRGVEGDCGERG